MYKLLPKTQTPAGMVDSECIKRLADNAFIPFDPANVDYQAYLAWLAEGNVPLAADALVPQENGDTFTLSV
jgi:hypothetical protein